MSKPFLMNEQYPEYAKPIKGLCPAADSCDICRAARIADKGYQAYLAKKWQHEIVIENQRTLENAIAHDRNGGYPACKRGWKGNEQAVRLFQSGGIK